MIAQIKGELALLNFRYKKYVFSEAIRLHIEVLTPLSQVKNLVLQTLTTKRIQLSSNRGPAKVQERLRKNLREINLRNKNGIDWVLNINSKAGWQKMILNSRNIILGPNIEFTHKHIQERIQNLSNSIILVPSDWVIPVLQEQLYWFRGRYVVWRSDLDTNFWKPKKTIKKKHILIYRKNDHLNDDFSEVVKSCEILKLNYKVITYGNYGRYSFRRALRQSHFAVWLGTTESQGISLLESWSTDTPTFVRECDIYFDQFSGKNFMASAAPYLTGDCGSFFKSGEITVEKIIDFMEKSMVLNPRDYVNFEYSKEKISKELNDLLVNLDT